MQLGQGQYDLCTPYFIYVDFQARQGTLEPIDLAKVPNYDKTFPFIKQMQGLVVDGQQYAVPLTFGSMPLMYNAKEVTTAPTSWMDLFKPEFKGKVAIVNDINAVMVVWTRVATGAKVGTQATREELKKTVELLIKLKKEQLRTISHELRRARRSHGPRRGHHCAGLGAGGRLGRRQGRGSNGLARRKARSPSSTATASPRARRSSRPITRS